MLCIVDAIGGPSDLRLLVKGNIKWGLIQITLIQSS